MSQARPWDKVWYDVTPIVAPVKDFPIESNLSRHVRAAKSNKDPLELLSPELLNKNGYIGEN